MKELYFNNDEKRGIPISFLWFMEEIGELSEAIRKYLTQKESIESKKTPSSNKSNLEYKNDIQEEMADVVAWLCSLANLLEIDLETAMHRKYPDKCGKCGHNPCVCKH
jgi:NTP pyrophosphatase (non-canonical NTP hydrolase)